MKNSNDPIGNRTRDLLACSGMPFQFYKDSNCRVCLQKYGFVVSYAFSLTSNICTGGLHFMDYDLTTYSLPSF